MSVAGATLGVVWRSVGRLYWLADERAQLLQTIPGVGLKTAEVAVAFFDDPHCFQNWQQVSSYSGLVPRQCQSGEMNRQGRIRKNAGHDNSQVSEHIANLQHRNPKVRAKAFGALRFMGPDVKDALIPLIERRTTRTKKSDQRLPRHCPVSLQWIPSGRILSGLRTVIRRRDS